MKNCFGMIARRLRKSYPREQIRRLARLNVNEWSDGKLRPLIRVIRGNDIHAKNDKRCANKRYKKHERGNGDDRLIFLRIPDSNADRCENNK